ncbi:hypothetical protein FACS1894166_01280 [Bacilli bacterium]|nr:hypothetical protein FACS1894166_01280 [Bacilli bacterium]
MKNDSVITTDAILDIYKKNQSFYKNGGITLSGGEPLLHLDFCIELAKKCKAHKISLAVDTSGCTFTKDKLVKFKQLTQYQPL